MATATKPQTSDAEEALHLIAELNERIGKARVDFGHKSEMAKASKKRLESLQEELENLISDLSKPRPLFDRISKPAIPADAVTQDDDDQAEQAEDWREVPVTDLDLGDSLAAKLAEAGIGTVGAIADYTSGGNHLTDLEGIGPAKAEQIEAALEGFWASRKAQGIESDSEDVEDAIESSEETPDGEPVEDWRSVPLATFDQGRDWEAEEHRDLCRAALEALARPLDDETPGVETLGDLVTLIEAEDLDSISVANAEGKTTGLPPEQIQALRFALLNYREKHEAFAGECPVWWIDPTLREHVFKIEFKRPRAKKGEAMAEAPAPCYVRANSKHAAVDAAAQQWGDTVSGVWPVEGDKPPDGSVVYKAPLESYEERRARWKAEEDARLAAAEIPKTVPEPEPQPQAQA